MTNLTPPRVAGEVDRPFRRLPDRQGSWRVATPAPVSVDNGARVAPARTQWLSGVPQQELDALSAALRKGPLDAHFFLTLEPGFHRTVLASPMAQPLVDDALGHLLPAGLTRAQRGAWRTCLTGLLTLPRVAWEVECVGLRGQLSAAVARRNALLGAVREALYRPVDMPRRAWDAALAARPTASMDCRTVACALQRTPTATQRARALQQLRGWLPGLPQDEVESALARAAALAARDGTAIDVRTALPALFNALDEDRCARVSDAQRADILGHLEGLAGGALEPLLRTGGGDGDDLGRWLLSVADRAGRWDPSAPGLRQAVAEALLFAASVSTGMQALCARGVSVVCAAQGSVWSPITPGHVPAVVGPAVRSGSGGMLPSVASAAPPRGGRGLLALAGGLVGSGLALAASGWHWISAPADTGTATPGDCTRAAIALLDTLVTVDGTATVWRSMWEQVQAAPGDDPETLAAAVSATLLANDVAREVALLFDPHRGAGPSKTSSFATRQRRAVAVPPTLQPHEVLDLHAASLRLARAARQAPPPAAAFDAIVLGQGDPALLAAVRTRMLAWLRSSGENATVQHAALRAAWRDLVLSDQALQQVRDELPQLDRHLARSVASDIRNVTGQWLDPGQIYLNTFAQSETRATWEARQFRAPGAAFRRPGHRASPDMRVRSELVSAHTLVGAALLPQEADVERSGLYYNAAQEIYFPEQECATLTLPQFNQAVAGRDYLTAFAANYRAFAAGDAAGQATAVRNRYMDAISRRLSATAVLLQAVGQLGVQEGALVADLLMQGPGQQAETDPGRPAGASRGRVHVRLLTGTVDGGAPVTLHGVLLVHAARSPDDGRSPVLVLSPSRTPALQPFVSAEAALCQLTTEVARRLSEWVPAGEHAQWRQGAVPIEQGDVIEGDFRAVLFRQALQLRVAQLDERRDRPAPARRHAFNALERELAQLHLPVSMPVMAAAAELAARDPVALAGSDQVHWSARLPPGGPGTLRNAGVDDARWLHALAAGRGLLDARYPRLAAFIEQRLDQEILRRHQVVLSSRSCYIVEFNGGVPSPQTRSGWVHSTLQRVRSASFAYLAMTRGDAFIDRNATFMGLYTTPESVVFDENNEVADLEASQLLAIVRELDLQREYLQALDAFWTTQQSELLSVVRGSYLFSCWQQYAEGSLSSRGLQLALAGFGQLDAARAQDSAHALQPVGAARAGWLQIHGVSSTVLHLSDARGPEVVLYWASDAHRFHEFAHDAAMMRWLEQTAAQEDGRAGIEAAFDLADLQQGWFSDGVHRSLGGGAVAMFGSGPLSSPITGDPSLALVHRLRDRSRRDAITLLTSPWESFRHRWIERLARFNEAAGIASLVMPTLLPVVFMGSAAEFALGLDEALDAHTEQARRAGAVAAASGLLGVVLSAPLGTARVASLAASDGARLQPAVLAPLLDGASDPLEHVAERFAQPVEVAGPRAADNGVHHHLGKQYIEQAGRTYEVFFDHPHGTWRLRHPAGGFHHQPVRLNAAGWWEPHSDVGLRGGAPNRAGPAGSAEGRYRGALAAREDQLRGAPLSSGALDFKWGKDHWQRVVLPETVGDAASVERMKALFVSGDLDPVQQGALSVVIARLDNLLRSERHIRSAAALQKTIEEAGGHFVPASQVLLADGGAGMCTALSRIMAVALAQGEETQLLDQLRRAIHRPASALAANVREVLRDAQGAGLLPGSLSAPSLIGITELARLLATTSGSAEFILSGSRHSMACAVRVADNGERLLFFFDPNKGFFSHSNAVRFDQTLTHLLTSRHLSRLDSPVATQRVQETLAELYGGFEGTDETVKFHLRQVNTGRLHAQAAIRGWTSLFEHVP
jgi:hypothetical protein